MKKLRILAGLAATIALAALLRRIGLSQLAAQLRNLGVVLPILVVTGLMRLLLQTRAWSIALRADGISVPEHRLIGARLASLAAGYLVSLGPVASEPAKLVLLRNPTGAAAAAPATLFETGVFWFTSVVLGLAGTCAAALVIGHSRVLWLAVGVFCAGLPLLITKRSLLSVSVRAAGARAPKWLRSAEDGERRIRSFRDRHKRAAGKILVLDSIAQVVMLAEVVVVLWSAGIHFSLLQVLTIEAAGRVVQIIGAWVPGRIGMDEGGAAASFALLRLSPATGLMLALARRMRDLLWCVAGIVWAAGSQRRPAVSLPKIPATIPQELPSE